MRALDKTRPPDERHAERAVRRVEPQLRPWPRRARPAPRGALPRSAARGHSPATHVCSIHTEQCCEIAIRHASDRDWEVDCVTEATLAFAMISANGRRYTRADIKAHTKLVLAGRFARILTVEDALSGPELSVAERPTA